MPTTREVAPTPPAEEAGSASKLLPLAAVGLLAALGFAWAFQTYQRGEDRRVVLRQVRDIQSQLRAHGPELWWLVEGNDSQGKRDAGVEARHQAILHDFERLAHLEDLEMTNIVVEVRSQEALASYQITATARPGDRVPPASGEIRFRRGPTGWRLEAHRLLERR